MPNLLLSSSNFLGIQRIIWISYRLGKSFNFSPSGSQPFVFQFSDLCLVVEPSARFRSLCARLCRQISIYYAYSALTPVWRPIIARQNCLLIFFCLHVGQHSRNVLLHSAYVCLLRKNHRRVYRASSIHHGLTLCRGGELSLPILSLWSWLMTDSVWPIGIWE